MIGILGVALSLGSCKKEQVTQEVEQSQQTEAQVNSTADNAGAEDLSSDMLETSQDVVDNNYGSGKTNALCANILIDSLGVDLKQITVDFGEGCVGLDGRTRKGKIIILVNGRPWIPGSSLEIKPEDYFVDDFKLEGTKYVYYNGKNSAGNYHFVVKLVEGKVTSPDGVFITLEFEKNHELIFGDSTTLDDDMMLTTGEGHGTNRDGIAYNVKTLKPLKRVRLCRNIVEGILEITSDGKPTFTIDFGDGTCDDLATVSGNGKSWVVKIKRPWKRK